MFVSKMSTIKWINANRSVSQIIALRNCSSGLQTPNKPQPNNREHLFKVHQQLAESLPQFFTQSHCYNIYHQSIVFEDNIRHIKTIGLSNYVKQLNFVKVWGHFKYSHKELNVLKITEHPEDMTVRVRWRIVGTPGLSSLLIFYFWKYRPFENKKNMTKDKTEWTDGFSIFQVGSDGLVHRHIVEKIIPDEERLETNSKSGLSNMKLAFIIGLMPALSSESIDFFRLCLQNLLDLSTKYGSFG